jgi:hypothetical protein
MFVGDSSCLVSAQTYDNITITSNGDIVGTSLIECNGDVYTFTGDIYGTIKVEKDLVTIDGDGYKLRGAGNGINLRKNNAENASSAYGYSTIKNVHFCDGTSIFASANGNIFTYNTFEGGKIDIRGNDEGLGNIINCNVFINSNPALAIDYSKGATTLENDFINCTIWLGLHSGGSIIGNYWSDYTVLYPDAKELFYSEVWDTPYNSSLAALGYPFVDPLPLINPTNGGAPNDGYETPIIIEEIITITSSGDVEGSDLIKRNGDVYTFTGDINVTIKVEKDGIIIDGAGYALSGDGNAINLKESDDYCSLSTGYGNVTVKNVRFSDGTVISASSNGNSFINNTFEGGGIILRYNENPGVLIKHNVFINCEAALSVDYASGVTVVENDFINSKIGIFLYGRASFDRNYWSDYKTVYPNAKEIDNTGVWNIPYNSSTTALDFSFVDYNPLVNPINCETQKSIDSTKNDAFPITSLLAIVTIITAITVTVLVVTRKSH